MTWWGRPNGETANTRTRLVALTDETYDEVMNAPVAVVIVLKEASGQAARYLAELRTAQECGEFGEAIVATLDRDAGHGGRFAREHPWVTGVRVLPYSVVFSLGRKVDEFAAIQAETLVRRLVGLRAEKVGDAIDPAADHWWSARLRNRKTAA
jgi:thioredoxin-like negative regulator of GroEL